MPILLPERFAGECIREFDLAADERYADAERLASGDRRTGAIYLYGYVVEMLLKAAFLRLTGYADEQVVTTPELRLMVGNSPASTARGLGLAGCQNLHDIRGWAELVVAYRADRGLVYTTPGFGAALVDEVGSVADRWSEVTRYHRNRAYAHELERVRSATRWVVANRSDI